jgi:hypothetical protein
MQVKWSSLCTQQWRARSVTRERPSSNLETGLHLLAKKRLQLGGCLIVYSIGGVVYTGVGKDTPHVRVEDLERDVVALSFQSPCDRLQICHTKQDVMKRMKTSNGPAF